MIFGSRVRIPKEASVGAPAFNPRRRANRRLFGGLGSSVDAHSFSVFSKVPEKNLGEFRGFHFDRVILEKGGR